MPCMVGPCPYLSPAPSRYPRYPSILMAFRWISMRECCVSGEAGHWLRSLLRVTQIVRSTVCR
jgi:hypothetical protein